MERKFLGSWRGSSLEVRRHMTLVQLVSYCCFFVPILLDQTSYKWVHFCSMKLCLIETHQPSKNKTFTIFYLFAYMCLCFFLAVFSPLYIIQNLYICSIHNYEFVALNLSTKNPDKTPVLDWSIKFIYWVETFFNQHLLTSFVLNYQPKSTHKTHEHEPPLHSTKHLQDSINSSKLTFIVGHSKNICCVVSFQTTTTHADDYTLIFT